MKSANITTGIVEPLIETENLTLQYGQKTAFANVNLSVNLGEILALVGPSGCGKTSFLSCLNRLTDMIPQCRVKGRIRIGSLEVLNAKTNANALRRQVGMIFQKPNPFPLSIWKNLELPLREHGIRKEQIDAIVETSLKDVGLWDEVKTDCKPLP
ncbi:phosphate ABC transporter ATP-binding protein [Nostoc sp. 'Peltigera malacea cyanobiont' DB3992]|uniref:phosphate ABC transporter ATP-binding protein n=1 Tax=Nostoc sp. 'Peltigera malacea cyanobiont' DB3992 TaxID=1206980 RepID=UPI00211E3002|nr:ATP-binding cassette domain-containing protein [Nostoc sp. 'Peltigera malacea cyanobiont' DB3992]